MSSGYTYNLSRQIQNCSRKGTLEDAIDFVPPPRNWVGAGSEFPQTVLRVRLPDEIKPSMQPASKLVAKAFFGDSPPVLPRLGEQGESFNKMGKIPLKDKGLSHFDEGHVYFVFEEGFKLPNEPGGYVSLRYEVTFTPKGGPNEDSRRTSGGEKPLSTTLG